MSPREVNTTLFLNLISNLFSQFNGKITSLEKELASMGEPKTLEDHDKKLALTVTLSIYGGIYNEYLSIIHLTSVGVDHQKGC
jgi:hypothetical protein